MKKFMVVALCLVLAGMGLYYAIYYGGFYVNWQPDAPVQVDFRTTGDAIERRTEQGEYVPFAVRGVDVPSSLPGHPTADYAVDEAVWMRWFEAIAQMGANTVRAYTIYDPGFYNSLLRFNTESESPLYLLQGIQVTDYANNSGEDAYGPGFFDELKGDALDAVDVVHGRKDIPYNEDGRGGGRYRSDVSPWVLGYIVGNGWNAGTVAYTDHGDHSTLYNGRYVSTAEGAGAFEAMLARILDETAAFETGKYHTQRLLAFQNDPQNDPFEYETHYARQLNKINRLNAEHLVASDELQSGLFAAYQVYSFCPTFYDCFTDEQQEEIQRLGIEIDGERVFEGYADLLCGYHTIPVVVTGYGFSSARGADSDEGPYTEREQGERLAEAYGDFVDAGCAGAFISTWQDVWDRRTWNTSFAVDLGNAALWHDRQTTGQSGGLLAFDPGKEQSVCYVDGDPSEWQGQSPVAQGEGYTLWARYDEQGLYLLVTGEINENTRLVIPLDVTPFSGSRLSAAPALRYTRGVDFLVCLQGNASRLLVQARYEAIRENYLMQLELEDPFVSFPRLDSMRFVPVRMLLANDNLVPDGATDAQRRQAKLFDALETGQLRLGNANPASDDYDSLADICYGQDCVELRLPWLLLNVGDPVTMRVHGDYYVHYGVEHTPVEEIFLGVGREDTRDEIVLEAFALEGWDEPTYHERLKESYHVMKECWGDGNAA